MPEKMKAFSCHPFDTSNKIVKYNLYEHPIHIYIDIDIDMHIHIVHIQIIQCKTQRMGFQYGTF